MVTTWFHFVFKAVDERCIAINRPLFDVPFGRWALWCICGNTLCFCFMIFPIETHTVWACTRGFCAGVIMWRSHIITSSTAPLFAQLTFCITIHTVCMCVRWCLDRKKVLTTGSMYQNDHRCQRLLIVRDNVCIVCLTHSHTNGCVTKERRVTAVLYHLCGWLSMMGRWRCPGTYGVLGILGWVYPCPYRPQSPCRRLRGKRAFLLCRDQKTASEMWNAMYAPYGCKA